MRVNGQRGTTVVLATHEYRVVTRYQVPRALASLKLRVDEQIAFELFDGDRFS